MTRASRLVALVVLSAVLMVSCARLGSAGFTGRPADIYAAGPSVSDVRTLLGDPNWWQGPPSFELRPLDAATIPYTERFSVSQRFIRLGTAEEFFVRYTVYDKVTSATTAMTDYENAFGPSPSTPSVGDKVLYYGLGGSGGAPYVTRTFVRLGQIVVLIIWSRKDGIPTIQQLGKNATMIIGGLKKVVAGKPHPTPPAVDPKLLPNPGLDITYLGSAQLPIEAWVVMLHSALPGPVLQVLHDVGLNDFAYGDFALNNDTHMEVQTALFTFPTSSGAADWVTQFSPGTADANGISWAYIPVAGAVEGSGEYHYYFSAGTRGVMMVCAATAPGEAASRACEAPMERTAISWKFALGG